MKLSETLEAELAPPSCKVCNILEQLDEEDARALKAVLDGRLIGREKLRRILQKAGYTCGKVAIQKHQAESR